MVFTGDFFLQTTSSVLFNFNFYTVNDQQLKQPLKNACLSYHTNMHFITKLRLAMKLGHFGM